MDLSPAAAAKLLLPKAPYIAKTVARHRLRLSKTSRLWSLRTELIIKVLRSLMYSPNPQSVLIQQKQSLKDPGIKGALWVSTVTAPKPEENVRQLLFKTIDDLKQGDETYFKPDIQAVEAEWTGSRSGVGKDATIPAGLSEEAKYGKLMADVKSDVVVLYFHGGAYYLLDPCSHRPVTRRLAKKTGGKVLSVRYRLAPQNPFPSALLDALCSYLYLLYPPEDSFHKPALAKNIVFSGDSAGGNLSVALLEVILHLHNIAAEGVIPTVNFHGKEVEIPIPAGVAVISPWLDITHGMPSLEKNAKYDFLPPPSVTAHMEVSPCDIWPTDPVRADLFCDGRTMCHPLVSPLASPASTWAKSPPMFIGLGEEMLADESAVFTQHLVQAGVKVVWEQYQAMPHCFATILEGHRGAKLFMEKCADFIKLAVEQPEKVETRGWRISAKKLERTEVDVTTLVPYTDEEVLKWMCEARDKKIKRFEVPEKSKAPEAAKSPDKSMHKL